MIGAAMKRAAAFDGTEILTGSPNIDLALLERRPALLALHGNRLDGFPGWAAPIESGTSMRAAWTAVL
jgi:hypothetical protein